MYERIVEIIVFVISELRQNKHINDIDLAELERRGYTSAEISTAFSWLVDRIEFSDKFLFDSSMSSQSFRILHEAEKDLFTPEAWGEIIQLATLGLISNENVEALIDRASMMGMRQLDSYQLKTFVANNVFNAQMQTLPGNRLMLHGSDTIN